MIAYTVQALIALAPILVPLVGFFFLVAFAKIAVRRQIRKIFQSRSRKHHE